MILKQFPHLLRAEQLDDLTSEQQTLLQCHLMLDQGISPCAQCGELGSERYCPACGKSRYAPAGKKPQQCSNCKNEGTTRYCGYCGEALYSETIEQLDNGTFDWAALEKQLEPFMQPLSEHEEAMLLHAATTLEGL